MLKRTGGLLLAGFLSLAIFACFDRNVAAQEVGLETALNLDKRLILLRLNLINKPGLNKGLALLERAAAAGYNGIIYSDTKMNNWFISDYANWRGNVETLRQRTEALGLEFIVSALPYGYCGPMLAHDPNLAEGVPIKNAPLIVQDGRLVAQETASLSNGSFETYRLDKANDWFQDDAGAGSFIDTTTVKEGGASLRFENVGEVNEFGHGRVIQTLEVEPFQQYRLSAWLKMENLSARLVNAIVLAGEDERLLSQNITLPNGSKSPIHIKSVDNKTLPWTKISWTFNSLAHSEVKIIVGMWGGQSGKLWLDHLRLETIPTLNVLRRNNLPLTITSGERVLQEGIDYERLNDPQLGVVPYRGKYDLARLAPDIQVTEGSSLQEGELVSFSAYHVQVVPNGHASCSLQDEGVFNVAESIVQAAHDAFAPDAYLIGFSEMRSGGWEPAAAEFEPTGRLLAANIEQNTAMIEAQTDKPQYVWADMFDPNHNARENYYQMRGDVGESWLGMPQALVPIVWWEGEKIDQHGNASLSFFAEQDHRTIIGGYYNEDVETNYARWLVASEGVEGIVGTLFATWNDDYSDLEHFAEVWWGGEAIED